MIKSHTFNVMDDDLVNPQTYIRKAMSVTLKLKKVTVNNCSNTLYHRIGL